MDNHLNSYYCNTCGFSFIHTGQSVMSGTNFGHCPKCNNIIINLTEVGSFKASNSESYFAYAGIYILFIFGCFLLKDAHHQKTWFIFWIGFFGILSFLTLFSYRIEMGSQPFCFVKKLFFLWFIPIWSESYKYEECNCIEMRVKPRGSEYSHEIFLIRLNGKDVLIRDCFTSELGVNEHCEHWAHTLSAISGLPITKNIEASPLLKVNDLLAQESKFSKEIYAQNTPSESAFEKPPKMRPRPPFYVNLFLILLILPGLLFFSGAAYSLWKSKQVFDWPIVQGKLFSCKGIDEYSDGHEVITIKVKYSYVVNNILYESTRLGFGYNGSVDINTHKNIINKLCSKDIVSVSYNPLKPKEAALTDINENNSLNIMKNTGVYLFFGILFFLIVNLLPINWNSNSSHSDL